MSRKYYDMRGRDRFIFVSACIIDDFEHLRNV